jgi:hypothetical protein
MQLFDLLFILLFFTTVRTLFTAAWAAVRGRFESAGRILFRLGIGAVIYFAVVIVTSLLLPRRILVAGDPECFDDWCISLSGFHRVPQGNRVAYNLDLRVSSRARRASQREKNMAVYLTDQSGHRYDPVVDPNATPFSVLLGPGDSVPISRTFLLPAGAADVGAVLTHEGGFPIGWLIIGYDTWFRKPPMVRLQ